jgi:hypothetical protein
MISGVIVKDTKKRVREGHHALIDLIDLLQRPQLMCAKLSAGKQIACPRRYE